MTIKESLRKSPEQLAYDTLFNSYLQERKEKNDTIRAGSEDIFHASALASRYFCLIEAVLDAKKKPKPMVYFSSMLRIFKAGDDIHAKHQEFWRKNKMAYAIEGKNYSKFLHMTATPDGLIKFMGKMTIAEIKSMNTFIFGKLKEVPKNAYVQAQIYMYLTATPQAVVIVEDKNTQDIKLFKVAFCINDALEYLMRRRLIMKYENKDKLPPKKFMYCKKKNQRKCKYNEICFK